jgi:hypothetical protein
MEWSRRSTRNDDARPLSADLFFRTRCAALDALIRDCFYKHQPDGIVELHYLESMIHSDWVWRRYSLIETELSNRPSDPQNAGTLKSVRKMIAGNARNRHQRSAACRRSKKASASKRGGGPETARARRKLGPLRQGPQLGTFLGQSGQYKCGCASRISAASSFAVSIWIKGPRPSPGQ